VDYLPGALQGLVRGTLLGRQPIGTSGDVKSLATLVVPANTRRGDSRLELMAGVTLNGGGIGGQTVEIFLSTAIDSETGKIETESFGITASEDAGLVYSPTLVVPPAGVTYYITAKKTAGGVTALFARAGSCVAYDFGLDF
jgi:hypothetical protein